MNTRWSENDVRDLLLEDQDRNAPDVDAVMGQLHGRRVTSPTRRGWAMLGVAAAVAVVAISTVALQSTRTDRPSPGDVPSASTIATVDPPPTTVPATESPSGTTRSGSLESRAAVADGMDPDGVARIEEGAAAGRALARFADLTRHDRGFGGAVVESDADRVVLYWRTSDLPAASTSRIDELIAQARAEDGIEVVVVEVAFGEPEMSDFAVQIADLAQRRHGIQLVEFGAGATPDRFSFTGPELTAGSDAAEKLTALIREVTGHNIPVTFATDSGDPPRVMLMRTNPPTR